MHQPSAVRSWKQTTGVLALAVVGFATQQTAVVPAIQDVERALHASSAWSAWLVTGYLMVATVATLAMGRLADLYGRRRMLLVGMAVFGIAAIGAAAAPGMVVLILFRAVQGIGGAIYPLALSIARDRAPAERVTTAIAVLTGGFGVGTGIGFVCGGALSAYLSWRGVFALGAAMVLAAAVVAARAVPETRDRARGGFDGWGTVVMGVGAVALLTALTLVVSLGWTSPVTIGLLVVAAAFAAGWVYVERHVENPLVDLHVLLDRRVATANLATIGLGWTLFSAYLLVPQFVRASPGRDGYGLALGSLGVGLVLIPLAVGQTGATALAGWTIPRWGGRPPFAAGLVLLAGGTLVFALNHASLPLSALGTFLLGCGAGTGLQAASAVATEGVAEDVAGISASVNSTTRRLFGGIGGQTSTILLAALVVGGAGSEPSFDAFRVAWSVGGALCLAGAALALLGPARSRGRATGG